MTGGRRIAFALAALALVAACAILGATLWDTTVPDDLELPHVGQDEFDAEAVREAEAHDALARWLVIGGHLATVVTLALYVPRGPRLMRESAAGPIGTGFMLGILGFSLVWLVQLPFSLASFLWAKKYDLVEVSVLEWAFEQGFGVFGTALNVSAVLLVVMGFARLVGSAWFVPAALLIAALMLGISFASPLLVEAELDTPPAEVREDAERLAAREGLPDVEVREQEVSEWTSAPNAFAFGLGSTRKVVLWDTLTESFPRDEVRVVLAHELGHHRHQHILKSVWWMALFVLPAGFVVALVTRRSGGMRDPRAVPLALLVFVVLELAMLPLDSTWSRRLEAEADWAALQATRDPAAMEELFKGFTAEGLGDPDPPGWWETVFESHPSGADRVAMARAWRERHGR